MYITKKKIKGKEYWYLRKSVREGKKVMSKDVAYLGKNKQEAEEKARKIIEGEKVKNTGNGEKFMIEKKKIYLVHGWGGSSNYTIFNWMKKEMKGKVEIYSFDMPSPDKPKIDEWVGFLQKNVKNLDENTYFVGHSIGCQAILRFLEQAQTNIKIGGCVFIAGWFNLKNLETEEEKKIASPWLAKRIDFDKVKKICNNFLALFSDNDVFVPLADEKIFKEKLGAKTIIKKNQGHFDEVEKVEEILDFFADAEKKSEEKKVTGDKKLTIDELAAFCKRKGFVFKSSEIYGGLAGFWDFGNLGVELMNNIKQDWWNYFVQQKENMTGIDASVMSHPRTWIASGHLKSFNDVSVKCKKCKKFNKVDKADLEKARCGFCSGELDKETAKDLNLMFSTKIGPVEEESVISYLRPETAQGMFLDFKLVSETSRKKLPFGIAQIGKCFRNEIAPRDFLFRSREFTIAEFEFFIHPEENKCKLLDKEHLNLKLRLLDKESQEKGRGELRETTISEMLKEKRLEEWHAYWLAEMLLWFKNIGLDNKKIKIREHMNDELSHYSSATFDLDYEYPFGSKEIAGIANRGQFDLSQHAKESGEKLEIFDEESKKRVIPKVIEPTFGMERVFLALLCQSYEHDFKRNNIVLKIPAKLSPVKAGIFPLVNDEKMIKLARGVYFDLRKEFNVVYDSGGSVGRRYSRADEAGYPYCITIDGDSIKGKDVTIRSRDTTEQVRIKIDKLKDVLNKLISAEISFGKAGKKVETRVK